MRKMFIRFLTIIRRIKSLDLTGNPNYHDWNRCDHLDYSEGKQQSSHLYDCIKNANKIIKKHFPYIKNLRFLEAYTQIIISAAILSKTTIDDGDENVSHPVGGKISK